MPSAPPVHQITGPARWALTALSLLMRLWLRSLHLSPTTATLRAVTYRESPVAFVLWHNRLFLAAELARRYRQGRPLHALVSASKDGAYLTAFFSLVGIQTVRGSSSNLAREAVSTLIDTLKSGHDIGLTPDGPRGPCYEVKPGSLIVTRRARAPMIVIGAQFSSAWQFRSWDRFVLPKPFSQVHLSARLLTPDALTGNREQDVAYLQNLLVALNPDPSSSTFAVI